MSVAAAIAVAAVVIVTVVVVIVVAVSCFSQVVCCRLSHGLLFAGGGLEAILVCRLNAAGCL